MVASTCDHHDLTTETTEALTERLYRLEEWPTSYAEALSADIRCGCGEDGEGGRCEWDDIDAIEDELGKRKKND